MLSFSRSNQGLARSERLSSANTDAGQGQSNDRDFMQLWVVRHATTLWNEQRRFQGHTDIPLCAEGIAEVRTWVLPAIPEVIYASPFRRAHHTAQLLYPGKEVRLDPRLREMGLGVWEGRTKEEVRLQFGELPNDGWYGLDYRGHGGETLREVMGRLKSWLEEVSPLPHKCVLVVSHKGTLTALYALATGWDNQSKPKPRLRFPNFHCFELASRGEVCLGSINIPVRGR